MNAKMVLLEGPFVAGPRTPPPKTEWPWPRTIDVHGGSVLGRKTMDL